jgi:hypothetical protein
MKFKLILFALLCLPLLAEAQFSGLSSNDSLYVKTLAGTKIVDKAFVDATLDTSQTVFTGHHKTFYVLLQSKDSARIFLNYQLSLDGVTFSPTVQGDSLNTTSNTGNVKAVDYTARFLGTPFIRMVYDVQTTGLGFSSATYTALFVRKIF